ncbi:MAG TPA: immunity 26/phosphotriesterase HocA family protein [Aquaticitalea sp.]|nr:immunity 26/phosphotriesterase HocA family protein [Aquaticitalea sp.]
MCSETRPNAKPQTFSIHDMTTHELTNEQRNYFGLDPIEKHWDRVTFNNDTYRPGSVLYFDKDTIKRHIISTEKEYSERHYDELTRDRAVLLPKTNKGKEKKLSISVLEQRQPTGVYLNINCGHLTIGNYNSQTTFYSTHWDNEQQSEKQISDLINDFITNSPENHFAEIDRYRNLKRQNIKYKSGDYFCFKLDRINYGFGRILLDVNKIRKKKLIDEFHGLKLLMGPPVIVELFAYSSTIKRLGIDELDKQPRLPSDVMMDNLLLYGEFEIIGHREIEDNEYDFPISYGRSIDQRRIVFLQWGLIHRELPQEKFFKYVTGETQLDQNPYGYYSIGFEPHYDRIEVIKTIKNKGVYNFDGASHYKAKWDLRNPKNKGIKDELFKVFGLDTTKSYYENSKMTGTELPSEINKQLK